MISNFVVMVIMMLMMEHVITCEIQLLEQFQLQECVSPTAHFNISHVRESQRSTLTGNCFLELLNLKHKFCNCVVTTGLTISCGHKIQNNFFYRLEQPSQIQLVSCFFYHPLKICFSRLKVILVYLENFFICCILRPRHFFAD